MAAGFVQILGTGPIGEVGRLIAAEGTPQKLPDPETDFSNDSAPRDVRIRDWPTREFRETLGERPRYCV